MIYEIILNEPYKEYMFAEMCEKYVDNFLNFNGNKVTLDGPDNVVGHIKDKWEKLSDDEDLMKKFYTSRSTRNWKEFEEEIRDKMSCRIRFTDRDTDD